MPLCECHVNHQKPSPQVVRMLEIVAAMRVSGCCHLCSLGFAIAALERESKGEDAIPAPLCPSNASSCRKRAVEAWRRMHAGDGERR